MPRGRHGGRRHGHRAHHRAHHHHHHGIGHHHHGIGHHHHHGIGRIGHRHGHHHHHHGIGWHFRPRRHRHVGGWPFRFVLFQRRRPTNVAPAITTVTTTTGETVNVAQPVTATVTQGGVANQPTVVPQQPAGYQQYPPQPGQQIPQAFQSGYPPQVQPDYPSQVPYPSADPYPPIDMKPVADYGDPNPPAQPMVYDASGQPVQADPTQLQQNEEFDECTCYCCCIL